jgi:hypothetical protein
MLFFNLSSGTCMSSNIPLTSLAVTIQRAYAYAFLVSLPFFLIKLYDATVRDPSLYEINDLNFPVNFLLRNILQSLCAHYFKLSFFGQNDRSSYDLRKKL